MTRSTRAPKVSRTPTGHDQPDDGPTAPTDPDADTLVVVAHHHGHTPDLHIDGAKPHYMGEDGHRVYGAWEPPDTLPYEYLGDHRDAHPDDHRHDGTAVSNHERGRESHRHAPIGGGRLPLEDASAPAAAAVTTNEADIEKYNPAEVEASQARHPSGHDPTDPYQQGFQAGEHATRQELANGDTADPAAIEQAKEAARAAGARLAGVPAPQPPPTRAVPAIANPAAGRLGADLGGLELVKASFRTLFPSAPDGLDQEWALTMGASDLIGQMLNQHRQPAFADPGLIAGLRTLVEQLDETAAARAAQP